MNEDLNLPMGDSLALREAFERAGQGQVFRFFDRLDEDARDRLLKQASEINLAEIDRLVRELVLTDSMVEPNVENWQPAPFIAAPVHGGDLNAWRKAEKMGGEALRNGRVAAFTVAGGQGTRLGFDGPKGSFPATPVRSKSLFQVFAEKILTASNRYHVAIPWLIMTSGDNHESTVRFFTENQFFGLESQGVRFFQQGRMPAVDFAGKILLQKPDGLALSPDGHGGSLRALARSGSLDLLKESGIDIISYFQVDNPLLQPIDPAFIGFHLMGESEMSSKMVCKANPTEKVGVFCLREDQLEVIEYSDLPEKLTLEKDESSGELRYRAGSIAIHLISRDFARQVGGDDPRFRLPFHRADKRVTAIDSEGRVVEPDSPNGVKFEMFAFDALGFAKNPIVVETLREDEFSPIKNAVGIDSAESSRQDQLRQWTRWLKAAGEDIATDETGLPGFSFEVSPIFADSKQAFLERWKNLETRPAIAEGTYLE